MICVWNVCRVARLFRIAYHYQMLKCPMTEGHVAYQLRQLLSAAMYCHQRALATRGLRGLRVSLMFETSAKVELCIGTGGFVHPE